MRTERRVRRLTLPLIAVALIIMGSCAAAPRGHLAGANTDTLAPVQSDDSSAESPRARAAQATQPAQLVAPLPPLALEQSLASRRDAYNRTYEQRQGYRIEPNAFLLECLERIESRRTQERRREQPPTTASQVAAALFRSQTAPALGALEIAMGDGRNAIPLLQRGYHVTGFDLSDVGINHARQRAADLGLADRADFQLADAYAFDYGSQRWDLIVMVYFYVGPDHIDRVKDAIKPGGYFLIECIDSSRSNAILAEFTEWEIIHYQHDSLPRDWAPYGPGRIGPVLRLLARKP